MVRARQANLTVILENVHDIHNIGAVLRSCDSIGIREFYVLYSDPRLNQDELLLGKRASSGARKWVDVHFFTETKACFMLRNQVVCVCDANNTDTLVHLPKIVGDRRQCRR